MHYLEIILIGIILFYPIVDLLIEKYKLQSKNKIVEYLKISFFIWIPTLLLIDLFSKGELSVVDFGLVIEHNWKNILFFSLLCIGIIYLLILIRTIISSEELRAEITSKFESYKDILPVTKNEMLIFTLVLSVSAGICEELLFRAYLFTLIDSHIGVIAAVLLSSALFGLWHIYLGWQEVIRTSAMGAVFCGVFIFTGNIIIPILLHIFVDIYSGLMCYFAMRKSSYSLKVS
ncbi:CPBP family intramembrane glutamic endopeptidase [Cognaticolwellia beringensis]|uniref:CPBP family intramembrane metalloprotease n=1 Tax=Cognaticolwellia beringensis TaxID=1967665 RepID=A0A222G5G9_9GAMM|nr:CPBP family intramembrane glutamic endopeptidase [Cognaticolwellia beringensis]ASP47089.1 CPBP family intramembrane metalloprotease [Cognaticolwellia beringensis]